MGRGKEGKDRGRDLPDQCQTAFYAPALVFPKLSVMTDRG